MFGEFFDVGRYKVDVGQYCIFNCWTVAGQNPFANMRKLVSDKRRDGIANMAVHVAET